jgi:hypothetical protein
MTKAKRCLGTEWSGRRCAVSGETCIRQDRRSWSYDPKNRVCRSQSTHSSADVG